MRTLLSKVNILLKNSKKITNPEWSITVSGTLRLRRTLTEGEYMYTFFPSYNIKQCLEKPNKELPAYLP